MVRSEYEGYGDLSHKTVPRLIPATRPHVAYARLGVAMARGQDVARGAEDLNTPRATTRHLYLVLTGSEAVPCPIACNCAIQSARRTWDKLPLGARTSDDMLYEDVVTLQRACSQLGMVVVPTLVESSYDHEPSLGLALAATDLHSLEVGSRVVQATSLELERLVEEWG